MDESLESKKDKRSGASRLKKQESTNTKRKKKSRWASTNDGTEGKTFIPGMPTILPSNLNADQQEAYLGDYKNSFAILITKFLYFLSINHFLHTHDDLILC